MPIYSGKKMSVIKGDKSNLSDVIHALRSGGAEVSIVHYECNLSALTAAQPSVIIVDTLSDKTEGISILNKLRKENIHKKIPILTLVEDDNEKIQSVLTLGASDYFFESEPFEMIETKVQTLLGHANNFAGSRVVSIPNDDITLDSNSARVLVVEDDPLLQSLLKERFLKADLQHTFCADGSTVAATITDFNPSVIVLDLMLPDKNGLDILAELKSSEATKNIPVIVFSNRDDEKDKVKAKELGAARFFVKIKTDLSELLSAIGQLTKY